MPVHTIHLTEQELDALDEYGETSHVEWLLATHYEGERFDWLEANGDGTFKDHLIWC